MSNIAFEVAEPRGALAQPTKQTATACTSTALDDEDDTRADWGQGPVGEEDDDGAAYTAELIRDALRDLPKNDSISQYERRLALREMKAVLRDAYEDRGEDAPSPTLRKYLRQDEHTQTNEQFQALREEMMRVLTELENRDATLRQLCRVVCSAWQAAEHTPDQSDLFELCIRRGGKGLFASAQTEQCLHAVVAAYLQPSHKLSSDEAGDEADKRRLLKQTLMACSTPEVKALSLCQAPAAGPQLSAAVGRVQASLDEYKSILEVITSLRDPVSSAGSPNAPPFEQLEVFLERGAAALKRMRRWQINAGVPYFVSQGERLRFGVPPEDVAHPVPFPRILEASLEKVERFSPCQSAGAWPNGGGSKAAFDSAP